LTISRELALATTDDAAPVEASLTYNWGAGPQFELVATLTNNGASTAEVTVDWLYNGVFFASQQASIPAGDAATLSQFRQKNTKGLYETRVYQGSGSDPVATAAVTVS
jgi:hypothetical protein